jgi:selenocysteine-specific elongation factor
VIIGTAGHIDHGKSALVEALTGRPMDRLAEERRRGITIELNFAPLDLDGGVRAGVVDVPGHEDFVRTMVAGAAGVDVALLVIAADEGLKPQTREHLAILEQLGVPVGVPVLTKTDLVEPNWLDLVEGEVRSVLDSSSVAFCGIHRVSVRTGEGIDPLRRTLRRLADATAPRSAGDAFRMPVDRIFAVAGAGTVVTGTVWTGSLSLGDPVRILPGECEGRVRSLEVHGGSVDRALPGTRTAIGLAGVDRSKIRRGDVLVTAELPWAETTALDVEVSLLAENARALQPRTRVWLHLGTAAVLARAQPRKPVEPGRRGIVRLVCEAPILARGGDRFVLRSYSPVLTIGGGTVLDPDPPRRRVAWPEDLSAPEPARRARALLSRHPDGLTNGQMALALGVPAAAVPGLFVGDHAVRESSNRWVLAQVLADAGRRAQERLAAYHGAHPTAPGMPAETLRRELRAPAWIAESAIAALTAEGRAVRELGLFRLSGFAPAVAGGAAAIDRIVALVAEGGLMAPDVPELERRTQHTDVGAVLRLAAAGGRVEAVRRDWYVAREALEEFVTGLRAVGSAGAITVGELRQRTGLSRKYLIPLLEWADRRGLTRRVGDVRMLT